jgi:ribose transport system substrate-binding protein
MRRNCMLRRHAIPLAALLAASCNRGGQRRIGVVPKATSHLFFMAVHAGVKQAAEEFAFDIDWNGPNDETDHARQIQVVDAMVAQKLSGLAISATDENTLSQAVQRAIDAGIPVTIFDSGVNARGYITFVATDNLAAGVTAADKLAVLVNPAANGGAIRKVGMVMHKPGGTSTMLREQGFETTMAKHPNVTIAARQYGMADRAKARAAAENMLTAHPDLAGLFASSEASSLGAMQAIEARGLSGKVKLITFDTSDSHVASLKAGTIDLMLVQDSRRMGYEAVKALATKLQGGTPPSRLDLPVQVIAKSDLSRPEIQSLLNPL